MEEKVSKGWRTATIILSVFVVLSILAFSWMVGLGAESIEKENTCAMNICQDYNTYYYDDIDSTCYCFENEEIMKTEYMV